MKNNMKTTKWADHKFSQQELHAQKIWRRCQTQRSELNDALKIINWGSNRDDLHTALDRRLNAIEKGEVRATLEFPEVGQSFTIATMQIKF